jgi:subtilisin-like proprotein convertase family protein
MNFSNFKARTYNEPCISSYWGEENDGLWTKEVEDRIDAYDQGKLNSIAFEKLIQKYR